MKRTKVLQVRFTPEEYDLLRDSAAKAGCGLGAYIRARLGLERVPVLFDNSWWGWISEPESGEPASVDQFDIECSGIGRVLGVGRSLVLREVVVNRSRERAAWTAVRKPFDLYIAPKLRGQDAVEPYGFVYFGCRLLFGDGLAVQGSISEFRLEYRESENWAVPVKGVASHG